MLLVTWRCCSPACPLLNEKRTGKKQLRVREGGAIEHTHRLRNRHGPMGAQRCLGAKTNSPESFGELYRTAETNSKQTSFRPDFVRNYVISVHSSISFWSISRPLGHGYSKVTKVIHCVFSGSDVGSKWQLLCSLLHSTTKHLNHLGAILVYICSGGETRVDWWQHTQGGSKVKR